ncbi:hypothetical protein Mal4_20260 [Maioricimonas rarisocia]|uniref:Uncharacterized protein n=1 Tax=Maioricimonas rarisocia TaxID=2528026 RepID=A0A517Z5E4_9PLAN|nr:hypothetical protein Mal4_20260 [Maioricimonas rarisocia]
MNKSVVALVLGLLLSMASGYALAGWYQSCSLEAIGTCENKTSSNASCYYVTGGRNDTCESTSDTMLGVCVHGFWSCGGTNCGGECAGNRLHSCNVPVSGCDSY